jgi:hypothetical protein
MSNRVAIMPASDNVCLGCVLSGLAQLDLLG